MNTCITRFGICIGDRKYLNEYTAFGSVSLWIFYDGKPRNELFFQAMEVESERLSRAPPEIDMSPGGVGITPALLSRLPPPPKPDPIDDTPANTGSESWHSQVPSVSIHLKQKTE